MDRVNIESDYSLDKLNTLRLKSTASAYIALDDIKQLKDISDIIKKNANKFLVLGGGSNIILPEIYSGLVIHNKLFGIEILDDNLSEFAKIKVMAGVNWDYFVKYSLEHGFFGLENLSLIPGTIGAAPIQNIGAYGVEVKDFIDYIEAYDIDAQKIVLIKNAECAFRYRDSIFKHTDGFKYIITAVVFKLLRNAHLNCSYGDVKMHMAALVDPTAMDLRQCIINIRQSKLPDPAKIGNVGSFFHNPILLDKQIKSLKNKFNALPTYSVDAIHAKVSAGWLIDNLGLKGYREGNLGIYEKQALVVVNYVGTESDTGMLVTQDNVLAFAKIVQDKVYKKYNISLNIEPIIIN